MTILYIFYIILYIIFNTTGMSHVKKNKRSTSLSFIST